MSVIYLPPTFLMKFRVRAFLFKLLIILEGAKLVPVVGLEPTRLFKVPGF